MAADPLQQISDPDNSLGSYESSSQSTPASRRAGAERTPAWLAGTQAVGFGLEGDGSDGSIKVIPEPSPPHRPVARKSAKQRRTAFSGCFSAPRGKPGSDGDDQSHSVSTEESYNDDDFDDDRDRIPQLARKYPLATVLSNPNALLWFREYASRTNAIDSVLLWIALDDYRNQTDNNKKTDMFHNIIEMFLKPGASHQVASFTFAQIAGALQVHERLVEAPAVTPELIASMNTVIHLQFELEITDLMEVYIRFVRTNDFQKMLKCSGIEPSTLALRKSVPS
jgi:hypothetical protein